MQTRYRLQAPMRAILDEPDGYALRTIPASALLVRLQRVPYWFDLRTRKRSQQLCSEWSVWIGKTATTWSPRMTWRLMLSLSKAPEAAI